MTQSTRLLSLVLLALASIASSAEPVQAQSPEWRKKMGELYRVLSELMPDITSDQRFNAPENHRRIEKNAQKLAEFSHGMGQKGGKADDADPSVAMIGGLFQSETDRAYRELKRGNRGYARSILRSVPTFCIGCHTRSGSGPQFDKLPSPSFEGFSPIEKAQFFAATRQFDSALDQFQSIIADPRAAEGRQLEWERSVRHALAIAVRVKNDPAQAQTIIDRVIAAPNAPQFMKEDALKWRQTVQDWQKEGRRETPTEEGLYAEATRLLSKALQMQKYPADRAAEVLYLRLTATVHELLRLYPNGKHAGEGLLLLGVSYEALRDLDLWSLHEMYYAACIQKVPHTPVAQNCYARLEQSLFVGYSGSGGSSLPEDVRVRLAKLREMAFEKAKISP